jgi:hypothetical protein
MSKVDRFWTLLSKKLAGEANKVELIEFSELMEESPLLKDHLRLFSAIWKPLESLNELTQEEIEAAFHKHLQHMKKVQKYP